MADAERRIIPVTTAQGRQYIDAIEGPIFDPQPYKIAETTKRSLMRLGFSGSEKLPSRAPLEDDLNARYNKLIASRYYQLTKEPGFKDPSEEERVKVGNTAFYVETEKPSLLVDMGSSRTFQIDLQLVRDSRYLMVYSHLHLRQKDAPYPDANMFMCSPGMFRLERNDEVPVGLYTPAFSEQQRLIAVNDLLRKHMKPTRG